MTAAGAENFGFGAKLYVSFKTDNYFVIHSYSPILSTAFARLSKVASPKCLPIS